MAGYTKEQYDTLYRFRVGRYVPALCGDPEAAAEVYVHYHKHMVKPLLEKRWSKCAPVLNIASTELVLIVGAGFGWGVEAFIAETGCTTIGIDVSDYIDAEKGNTETAELRQAITDGGLDPDTGRGALLLGLMDDGYPRTNVIVLKEDMQTNQSRNAIRSALGGWPTVVIFEDIIDDTTTDAEITQANNAANLFAGDQRVIWMHDGLAGRSIQDLQTLTGEEVISTDGTIYLVP